MDVDKTEPVIALVQDDVMGLVRDVICDAEVGLAVENDGRGCSSGGSGRSPLPLFKVLFLAGLVDNVLGGSEHDGREEITDD